MQKLLNLIRKPQLVSLDDRPFFFFRFSCCSNKKFRSILILKLPSCILWLLHLSFEKCTSTCFSSEREAGAASMVSASRNRSSPTSTLQQSDQNQGPFLHLLHSSTIKVPNPMFRSLSFIPDSKLSLSRPFKPLERRCR